LLAIVITLGTSKLLTEDLFNLRGSCVTMPVIVTTLSV
jgi:hypothetical protein